MKINDFDLSQSTLIIAELSANHGKDIKIAIDTIKAAKKAGADAIKLQTYTADTLTLDSDKDHFKISGGLWDGRTLYDLDRKSTRLNSSHVRISYAVFCLK